MCDLTIMVNIFLLINIDESGSRNVDALTYGIVSHVIIVAYTGKTCYHLAGINIENDEFPGIACGNE